MDAILTRPEAVTLILVLVVESVKALLLGAATTYKRGQSGKFINSEDANWLGGEVVIHDAPESGRFFRAHRNALENLLPFSVLALAFLLVGGNSLAAIVYFSTFALSRLAHSFAYLSCRPMLRRYAYPVAWLVQLTMALHVSSTLGLGLIKGI